MGTQTGRDPRRVSRTGLLCHPAPPPDRTKQATTALTWPGLTLNGPVSNFSGLPPHEDIMKIRNSLKSLKDRHRDNRVIRRRGRTYVINKTNRRFKARQG